MMEHDASAGEAHLCALEQVRRRVVGHFASADGPQPKWYETVLLVDDHYQGRRFNFADGAAVWSPEDSTIAILREGRAVEYLTVSSEESPLLKAA